MRFLGRSKNSNPASEKGTAPLGSGRRGWLVPQGLPGRRVRRERLLARRGVTLLELLIVMTIMLMITAATIPVILPATQNRRMREAARIASSFVSGARSRAIETGRPVGVMIERFNGLPFAMNLSYVEVPPPYGGDTANSRITVNATGAITRFVTPDALWQNVVRVGDLVQLDYRGPLYVIALVGSPPLANGATIPAANAPATTPWTLQLPSGGAFFLPPAYANPPGVSFQIFRQPVRSSAPPMQLPEGIVVDLVNSGAGLTGTWGTGISFNPIITFAPSGRVDYCTDTSGAWNRLNSPLYLLLGRRELMLDVSRSGTDENLYDPNPSSLHLQNFWIAVGYQTGLVTVTENAVNTSGNLTEARLFAQQSQSLGGR